MSDTSPTPIPTPDPAPAPAQSAPEPQAVQAPAPAEPPPPAESGATAGAEVPPEGGAAPPEAASPEPSPEPVPVMESTPATGNEVTSPVVDSPAAAVAVLGSDAGVHEGQPLLTDVDHAVSHPLDLLQRVRQKLAAYGEECVAAVRPELEALQKHHGG